ncbi:hypothetical protein Avbf_17180 [Armadillidium vulgare]|nr:hypothetical protein Avbf_17180 [Armadillidium vulgare]
MTLVLVVVLSISKMKLLFCGLCVFLFVFTMNFNEVSSLHLSDRYHVISILSILISTISSYCIVIIH